VEGLKRIDRVLLGVGKTTRDSPVLLVVQFMQSLDKQKLHLACCASKELNSLSLCIAKLQLQLPKLCELQT
jgi:hypothetical protein